MIHFPILSTFFFFNDTATTEIYTLSLHDALPISPAWARGGLGVHNDLQQLTGLDFETLHGAESPQHAATRLIEASRQLARPQRGTLVPNRPHAYLRGVGRALAWSDYPPQAWTVRLPRDGFVLVLAHQSETDRKSTRLNSSHLVISYAVFCLKKKKTTHS